MNPRNAHVDLLTRSVGSENERRAVEAPGAALAGPGELIEQLDLASEVSD